MELYINRRVCFHMKSIAVLIIILLNKWCLFFQVVSTEPATTPQHIQVLTLHTLSLKYVVVK